VDGVHPPKAVLVKVAVGNVPAAVVAEKLPAVPAVKVVEPVLVMVGLWLTVKVMVSLAEVP
jgi:hypothetical protein